MKKLLVTVLLIFGLVLTLSSSADALPFPDPYHPFIGSGEYPADPDVKEGSAMVSNIFDVGAGEVITFDYNFLTSEYGQGSPDVDDFFAAMLFDPYSDEAPLEFFTIAKVSDGGFTSITGGAVTPHGSYFTHQTGVQSGSFTVTSSHTDVSLAFGVFDVLDKEVDSGVLLDNISLPVPLGYFTSGLIGPSGFIIEIDDGAGPYNMYGGNVHLLPETGILTGVDTTGFDGAYAYMSTGPVVPEPISSALFLIGGATMGFRRFRKNKN